MPRVSESYSPLLQLNCSSLFLAFVSIVGFVRCRLHLQLSCRNQACYALASQYSNQMRQAFETPTLRLTNILEGHRKLLSEHSEKVPEHRITIAPTSHWSVKTILLTSKGFLQLSTCKESNVKAPDGMACFYFSHCSLSRRSQSRGHFQIHFRCILIDTSVYGRYAAFFPASRHNAIPRTPTGKSLNRDNK